MNDDLVTLIYTRNRVDLERLTNVLSVLRLTDYVIEIGLSLEDGQISIRETRRDLKS